MPKFVRPKIALPILLLLLAASSLPCFSAEQLFKAPPQVIDHPGADHAVLSRAFQGIPSLAIAPNGRLWATWYAGKTPAEDGNNYVVVATSGDNGKTWEESHIIDPDGDGPVRAYDPEMWLDPTGKLWSFWAQTIGHDGTVAGVWTMTTSNPDAAQPTWTKPQRLTDGVMMCKPTVLSTGEWILPASTWRKTDDSARLIVSRDQGKTWNLEGACNIPVDVRIFDEHMIVERKDGSLWMLVRVKYGIGQSVSKDRGKTWSPLQPSQIEHPTARFFVRRLNSGNLLLVKHGPIKERTGRSHLTAYLSKDDGETWEGGLLLDEREGVSYPDGQQDQNGLIHIIYDFSRRDQREILLTRFTEADILKGHPASKTAPFKTIVSKASPQ
jgi:predicted neuraminidase